MTHGTAMPEASAVHAALRPFLAGRLSAWFGLPALTLDALNAAFGVPVQSTDTHLGWYPAVCCVYPLPGLPSSGFNAYVRDGACVLIEALLPPPATVLVELGPPTTFKPHELLKPGAYVREYLYCERGLVLSVAEPLSGAGSVEVVRCRSVHVLHDPSQFGPEFHRAFEDQTVW